MAANQIVEMIHTRASLSGCAEVLLLSNSIKSLMLNSSPSQVSSSHVSTPVQIAKNIITNASFRAKKMQTDIPKVQVDSTIDESGVAPSSATKAALISMSSIVEEDSTSAISPVKEEDKTTPMKSESSTKGFNRDKLIAKLQLRKKTLSVSDEPASGQSSSSAASDKKEKKDAKSEKKKQKEREKERPDKLEMVSELTPLVAPSGLNGDSVSAASNSSKEYDTFEKVEELIQMRKLPPETITIHSPESGTTIF